MSSPTELHIGARAVPAHAEAMQIYINGEFHPAHEAKISVYDHSFLYGDGVFEGIRIDNGAIFRLREHVARLYRSAHFLQIQIPITLEEMAEAIKETARRSNLRDGYLRPIVTRGEGPMGIEATKSITRANIVIIPQVRSKFDDDIRFRRGLKAKIVSVRRTPAQCVDPRLKCNNYINHILGKLEQWDAGADVGFMLSPDGYLSEGCSENIFSVFQGHLRTPPASRTLDGITRRTIMTIAAKLGIDVAEAELTAYDLYTADEIFICGTLTELVPVATIDGRPIGTSVPGPMTRRLLGALREVMAAEAEPAF